MDRYLTRVCLRCGGHVSIYLNQPEQGTPFQAVNGHCVRCAYRLAWIVIPAQKQKSLPSSSDNVRLLDSGPDVESAQRRVLVDDFDLPSLSFSLASNCPQSLA